MVKYLVIGGTALAYIATGIHYWRDRTSKKPLLGVVQPKKEKVSKSQETDK